MKSITVTISPVGGTIIEADGFNGVGCKDASQSLVDVLADAKGAGVSVDEKPEFWQTEADGQILGN